MVPEAFATCMLAHIACIMYYSNKLQSELPIMKLMQQYTIYIISVLGLFNFFIIGYDVVTDFEWALHTTEQKNMKP